MLRKAIATDPRWPNTQARLGLMLAETGRLSEAMAYTQQATAEDVNVSWAPANAFINCGAGQTERGILDIRSFMRLFPESQYAGTLAVTCFLDAGRWADAGKTLDSVPRTWIVKRDEAHAFLKAAQFHQPGDVAEARRLALAEAEDGPNVSDSIDVLSNLGFVDEAFTVAKKFDPETSHEPSSFLFYPITAPLRRDPRFIALAARIGLVRYWKESGHWPDFCLDPALPYDCKVEAARLTGAATPADATGSPPPSPGALPKR
jgi:hypothetical protein